MYPCCNHHHVHCLLQLEHVHAPILVDIKHDIKYYLFQNFRVSEYNMVDHAIYKLSSGYMSLWMCQWIKNMCKNGRLKGRCNRVEKVSKAENPEDNFMQKISEHMTDEVWSEQADQSPEQHLQHTVSVPGACAHIVPGQAGRQAWEKEVNDLNSIHVHCSLALWFLYPSFQYPLTTITLATSIEIKNAHRSMDGTITRHWSGC